jgi:hypothetical protein
MMTYTAGTTCGLYVPWLGCVIPEILKREELMKQFFVFFSLFCGAVSSDNYGVDVSFPIHHKIDPKSYQVTIWNSLKFIFS